MKTWKDCLKTPLDPLPWVFTEVGTQERILREAEKPLAAAQPMKHGQVTENLRTTAQIDFQWSPRPSCTEGDEE